MGWSFPPYQRVKGNIDGSVKQGSGAVACGGAFREDSGRWLVGFAKNLGMSNVLMAELWGILTALQIAWRERFPKVWIESDSSVAITLLSRSCPASHPYSSIISSINNFRARDWETRIPHVLREGNRVANFLANMAHSLDFGLHVFRDMPIGCGCLAFQDSISVSFPRTVVF